MGSVPASPLPTFLTSTEDAPVGCVSSTDPSETQIELLELLITESRVFHSQITSLITRCPKNTLDLRQKLHSILMSI